MTCVIGKLLAPAAEEDDTEGTLTVAVEEDAVVIRVPLSLIKIAAEAAPFAHQADPDQDIYKPEERFRVTDVRAFGASVAEALEREQSDDGSTFITQALDDAIEATVEMGEPGFVWPANGIDDTTDLFQPLTNK